MKYSLQKTMKSIALGPTKTFQKNSKHKFKSSNQKQKFKKCSKTMFETIENQNKTSICFPICFLAQNEHTNNIQAKQPCLQHMEEQKNDHAFQSTFNG